MSDKPYEIAAAVVPTERQIKWQQREFYGMICFGMNTFTGAEWGDGFTPAEVFWPEDIDVDSWAETAKSAGMSALILTCKHIDGFCLWPTAMTDYSVKSCPNWMDGKGDIVRDLSIACRKNGLAFGVYLAPWDKHEKSYGNGKEYDDFFCGLLTELLTSYGNIFCVWLECLCGDGINGTTQQFDLPRYYKTIRELQPDCAIATLGPDVRWCGNQRGVVRKNEWSVIPAYLGADENGRKYEAPAKSKQNVMSLDLGSRKTIKKDTDFIWYPLEISMPMRDRWFFKTDDNYSVKTKDKLFKHYYNSVGNNANFLLGLSPDKRGRLFDTDVQILQSFGKDLNLYFCYDLVHDKGTVSASSNLSALYKEDNVKNSNSDSFWRPDDGDRHPEITIDLGAEDVFDKVVIQEHIRNGQHVEEFIIKYMDEKGKWRVFEEGTTVGYKRICHQKPVKTRYVKISFPEFRSFIEISRVFIN